MGNYLMTEKLQIANYIATILMIIKRDYASSTEHFRRIVNNGVILEELNDHYDFYHMYDYATVIDELGKKEPLIKEAVH